MTDPRLRVVALSGSLRRDSFNRRILDAAITLAPELDVAFLPIDRIPPYNADVEAAGVPARVARLKQAIDDSDGLLIVTPEYNASIPGVLKNAIDWASRPAYRSPLVGKPVALIAASPSRRGPSRALDELVQVLESTLAEPLPAPLSIAQVHEKVRGDEIVDEGLRQSVVDVLAALAQRLRLPTDTDVAERAVRAAS